MSGSGLECVTICEGCYRLSARRRLEASFPWQGWVSEGERGGKLPYMYGDAGDHALLLSLLVVWVGRGEAGSLLSIAELRGLNEGE